VSGRRWLPTTAAAKKTKSKMASSKQHTNNVRRKFEL
jgi:hypothetical protein